MEDIEKPSEEGGSSMLNKVGRQCHLPATMWKIGHCEDKCRKKISELTSTSRQLTNYATNSDFEDYSGMFVMQHKANSMSASDSTNNSNSEDVWFFDSDASNHMKSHEEWFSDMCTPNQLGYVETRHDTTHPIWHIGDALFGQNGKNNNICLARSDHNEEVSEDYFASEHICRVNVIREFREEEYEGET